LIEIFSIEFLAYTIGTIGYAIYVMASYFKARGTYLIFDIISATLVGIQWIMLDNVVPGAMNFAFAYAAICGYLLVQYNWIKYAYLLVFPACLYIYYYQGQEGWVDILALVFTLTSLSSRYFMNMNILRSMQLCSCLAWVGINISGGVYFGALCNIGFMIGHIKNLAANYIAHRKKVILSEAQTSLL